MDGVVALLDVQPGLGEGVQRIGVRELGQGRGASEVMTLTLAAPTDTAPGDR